MIHRWSALLLAALTGTVVQAQEFRVPSLDEGRAGKWEVAFQLNYIPSETYSGEFGSTIDLKSRTGWGFDVARNLNEHLALGFDFSWTRPRFTANLRATDSDPNNPQPGDDTVVSSRADIVTGQFYGVWNILKGDLTPFVEAGLGWTYIDSNIVDPDVPPVCWWDPWYGWICNSNTYSGTEFSYGSGLGLRWEPNNTLLVKLSYNLLWLDTKRSDPRLEGVKLEIGSRY